MGPRQRVRAVRSAGLGTGHAVVEALEQPSLETAGITRSGQSLEHRGRGGGANDGGAVGVDMCGQQGGGAQVVRG